MGRTMGRMSRLIDEVMSAEVGRPVRMEAGDAAPDFATVDLKPLEAKIQDRLGVKVDLTVKPGRYSGNFALESRNLLAGAGLFKSLMSEIVVKGVAQYDMEKEIFWLPIDVSYELSSGGSNGISLLTAWYEVKTKKWTFRDR